MTRDQEVNPAIDPFGPEPEGEDTAAHLLDVALGRAEPRVFWTDLRRPADDPPRRRSRVRTGGSKRLVVGGLAVLAAAAVFAVLGPGVESSSTPAVSTVGVAPPAVSTSAALPADVPSTDPSRTLGFALPQGWDDRCRPAPALDRNAQVALVCELVSGIESGPMRVELRRMDDGVIRAARFVELNGGSPSGTGPSRCARGKAEVRTWSRVGAPGDVVGSYGCLRRDSRAEIVWTDDTISLLGRAVALDDDLGGLYRWWTTDAPGAAVSEANGP